MPHFSSFGVMLRIGPKNNERPWENFKKRSDIVCLRHKKSPLAANGTRDRSREKLGSSIHETYLFWFKSSEKQMPNRIRYCKVCK